MLEDEAEAAVAAGVPVEADQTHHLFVAPAAFDELVRRRKASDDGSAAGNADSGYLTARVLAAESPPPDSQLHSCLLPCLLAAATQPAAGAVPPAAAAGYILRCGALVLRSEEASPAVPMAAVRVLLPTELLAYAAPVDCARLRIAAPPVPPPASPRVSPRGDGEGRWHSARGTPRERRDPGRPGRPANARPGSARPGSARDGGGARGQRRPPEPEPVPALTGALSHRSLQDPAQGCC